MTELVLARKELEIVKIKSGKKRFQILIIDKVLLSILNIIGSIKKSVTIVKPETVLKWQKELQKKYWTFNNEPKNNKVGRPETTLETKKLILKLKNENLIWGAGKIQGELKKLGIELDKKTIVGNAKGILRIQRNRFAVSW